MTHAPHLPRSLSNPMNRSDKLGLALSAAIPVGLAGLANLIILATGWGAEDPAYDAVSFSPPGWVIGVIWLAIFPMWGVARWKAYQAGTTGRTESWWAAALISWALAYPIVTAFVDTQASAWLNLFSLGLAVVTAWRLSTVSKTAAAWVLPSLAWLSFASVLGFAAVRTGL